MDADEDISAERVNKFDDMEELLKNLQGVDFSVEEAVNKMGEMADDILTGRCCSVCCAYFTDSDNPAAGYEHGYPAVCWDCWEEEEGWDEDDEWDEVANETRIARALVPTM